LFDDALRALDVTLLRGLVSASKHDDQQAASAREVQAITGAEGNPHFRHFVADRLPVAER
jgi:hypothetical protein